MQKWLEVLFRSFALGFSLGAIPSAAVGYCIGWDENAPHYDSRYYSVGHEFRRSQYVVRAKVLREIWIGEDGREKRLQPPFQNGASKPWGFDPYLGAFYELRVERVFKGRPPPVLRVFSENSTARFWLDRNQKILAFISSGMFDAPVKRQLTLDTCGNLRLFPNANRIMPAVLKAAKNTR